MSTNGLLKIGDLARLTSVPVKTIRHYSDIGVLPPAMVSENGYRYYLARDAMRLQQIRALREAGMGLEAIKTVIENEADFSTLLDQHLTEVESTIQNLQRQQAVLQVTLTNNERVSLIRFREKQLISQLNATQRRRYLGTQLKDALQTLPNHSDWHTKVWFWSEGVERLPLDIEGVQYRAWLELTDLVNEPLFRERLHSVVRASWKQHWQRSGTHTWLKDRDTILDLTLSLAQQGEVPQGIYAQELVNAYVVLNARLLHQDVDLAFMQQLYLTSQALNDPLFESFWWHLGKLRYPSRPEMWSKYQARLWLLEGLKWKIFKEGSADALAQLLP